MEFIFEVVNRNNDLRVCVELNEVVKISETCYGSLIEICGGEDIETEDNYDLLKMRFEKCLQNNKNEENEVSWRRLNVITNV
jgi:hypothetical protein